MDALEDWPKDKQLSKLAMAKRHKVPYESFRARSMGQRSPEEYYGSRQKLTPGEERVIVDTVIQTADRAIPMTHKQIVNLGNNIIKARGGKNLISHTSGWIYSFLTRHSPELKTHWGKPLDMKRAQSLNPEAVKHWFKEVVKKHMVDKETGETIDPGNMYGMDKSGFPRGVVGRSRVGRRETTVQHQIGGADRENVTVIVTFCADGTKLPPSIIFKGKQMRTEWHKGNTVGASSVFTRIILSYAYLHLRS